MPPDVPSSRGPVSEAVIAFLVDGRELPDPLALLASCDDPLVDDDLHLALWCCYELHHHGFAGVADDLEWNPALLSFRGHLERSFEAALRLELRGEALPSNPSTALWVIAAWHSPPLASTVERSATIDQLREFAIHRSAYQLKEADAHTFAIPRLAGPGRSAMIEIQADEYGSGRPGQAHAELFAAAMRELGLDDRFGHYVDRLPGTTLATDNLVEMFALHRRLRGALVGHLALFETTSVGSMSRYLGAARRFGGLPAVERFYAVHVDADVHHGALATNHMVTGVVDAEPELAPEVIFGAVALNRVESRFARHLLDRWEAGRSSLRPAGTAEPVAGPHRRSGRTHPGEPAARSRGLPAAMAAPLGG